jgi:hypothetical protein
MMNVLIRRVVLVCCLFVVGWSPTAFAQPGPGPEHAKLKVMEGKWKFVLKSADGNDSKGVMEAKMECGGLWLISDFKTDFGGAPFQGKGLDGYDPAKKKYVSVWVDSMTAAPMFFEGTMDSTGKILTLTSDAPGPEGGPAKWRSVTKFVSDDEHVFEMFLTPKGGNETSIMVVTYKRDK